MATFFDIKFSHWNHSPECKAWVDKSFDYYVLNFAETGSLEFKLGNNSPVRLNGPVAWLAFPGAHFQFGHKTHQKETWNHRYIAFHGTFADELMQRGIFSIDSPLIPIHNSDRFTVAFNELLYYLDNPVRGNGRATNMLIGLLLQLHEQKIELQFQQMDSRIKSLIKKIKESPAKDWDFEYEAAKMDLSLSHLRKLFTDAINQPPGVFLIAQRMILAAEVLKKTSLSITEIAEICSYDDIYYFNKSFKKHHAIPPGKYRKQARLLDI
jgi:AraC-like DNA-binding protein